MGALAGIACGMVAGLPFALLARKAEPNMGQGMAAVAVAFLALQTALFAVHLLRPGELVPFGALSVTSFLLMVVVAVIRRERGR